ncbi:MAG: hypothetical protein ABS35_18930 [Kaistia sp. SCN 65-12]|nr:MAG: hypothetical protein ABS35_18930 [Kaistia sp. SCN 65-12]
MFTLQLQLQGLLSRQFADLFSSVEAFLWGFVLAAALGLVHALTPGHGKAVIFSHFLGQPGSVASGFRVAGLAALTHGTIAVVLVLATGRVLSPLGRPTGAGAWVEIVAGALVAAIGALYVVLSIRDIRRGQTMEQRSHVETGPRALLAVAMGLLPCPLTIIVVGAAVARGATASGIVLAAAISVGAAVTIGCFGLLGMALRRAGMTAAGSRMHRIVRAIGWLELATSLLILAVGLGMATASIERLR